MGDQSVYEYIIVTKKRNSGFVSLTGFFLSISAAVLFLREMFIANQLDWTFTACILIITVIIIRNIIRTKKQQPAYYAIALIIAAVGWWKMPYLEFMVFVFALLAFLETQTKKPLEIGFTDDKIVFNTLIKRNILWKEIDNVVMKDGLLTIDFKNNKIFQSEIEGEEKEAEEDEFNEWAAKIRG